MAAGIVGVVAGVAQLKLPSWVDDVDTVVDGAWEHIRGHQGLDRLFYAASAAGDFSLVWHGFNIVRLITTPSGKNRFVRLAAALAIESLLVNQVIKRAFERERPDHDGDRPLPLRTPSTTSFPSGHASSAALAVSLLAQRSKAGPLAAAIGAIVATSRVHVRIHHASDVVAGAIVGVGLAHTWKRIWPLP